MSDFNTQCFACGKEIDPQNTNRNIQFKLPVCDDCKSTNREKEAIEQLLDGMVEGFVYGCI